MKKLILVLLVVVSTSPKVLTGLTKGTTCYYEARQEIKQEMQQEIHDTLAMILEQISVIKKGYRK